MEIIDPKQESINLETKNELKTIGAYNENVVLCNHCKRTSSNGIRCLGMCVADNDY